MKYRITKILIIVLPVISAGMYIAQIIVSNELAGNKGRLDTIERSIAELKTENERLKQDIASASSLTVVSQKAFSAGFSENSALVVFYDDTLPVAFNDTQ